MVWQAKRAAGAFLAPAKARGIVTRRAETARFLRRLGEHRSFIATRVEPVPAPPGALDGLQNDMLQRHSLGQSALRSRPSISSSAGVGSMRQKKPSSRRWNLPNSARLSQSSRGRADRRECRDQPPRPRRFTCLIWNRWSASRSAKLDPHANTISSARVPSNL